MSSIVSVGGQPAGLPVAGRGSSGTVLNPAAPSSQSRAGADLASILDLSDRASARLDESKKALGSLTSVVKSARRARSGQAKERLAQLVEQVKLLRRMGGDPKVLARRAAQLAKEIAAAAKDYAASTSGGTEGLAVTSAASGITASAGSTPGATATAEADPASSSRTEAPGSGEAPSSGETQGAENGAAAGEEAAKALAEAHDAEHQGETGAGPDRPADAKAGERPGDPAKPSDSPGQDPKAAIEPLAAQADANKARRGAIDAERRFFGEVKAAVSGLRALIERAAQDAKRKHDDRAAEETAEQIKHARKAAKEVDAAIDTIGQHDEGEPPTDAATGDAATGRDSAAADATGTDGAGADPAAASPVVVALPGVNLLV
ncbi:MAG: hypothetical protein GC191_11330 [Azospirillum sp.]|nr:hypothetical protein [Azospirillum sp.]